MPHEILNLLHLLPNDPAHWALVISVFSLTTSVALGGAGLAWNVHLGRRDRSPMLEVEIRILEPAESADGLDWEVEVKVSPRNSFPTFVDEVLLVAPNRRTEPVKIRTPLKPGAEPAVARFPLSQLKSQGIDLRQPFKSFVRLVPPYPPVVSHRIQVLPPRPPTFAEELIHRFEGRWTVYRIMSPDFHAAAALPRLEEGRRKAHG